MTPIAGLKAARLSFLADRERIEVVVCREGLRFIRRTRAGLDVRTVPWNLCYFAARGELGPPAQPRRELVKGGRP